jgi:hypothetical protein
MVLRDSRFGLFYSCSAFPECRATHGAHQATGEPLGTPADKATKEARIQAHDAFDKLWKPVQGRAQRAAARREAYAWMRDAMDLAPEDAHIGRFDRLQCERLIVAAEARLLAESIQGGDRG